MSSAVLCNLGGVLTSCLGCQDFVQLLSLHPDDLNVLRATSVYLHHLKDTGGLEDQLEKLLADFYRPLELNLTSPYAQVRLLTLQILSCLGTADVGADEKRGELESASYVFDLCLRAEEVPLTVQHYREKLKHLAKLNAEQLTASGVSLERYSMVPVLYLLGTLLVNFQVLWKPVQEILSSHASADGPFWSTFVGHLTRVYDHIESPVVPEVNLESGSNSRLLRVLEDAVESSTSPTDHPDYVNHRHLLWEAAGLFAGVAERRNKDVVALFYRFLEREFWPNTQTAPYHSILKADDSVALPAKAEEMPEKDADEASVFIVEEEDENAANEVAEAEQRKNANRAAPKVKLKLVRSLCDHLGVLAKFTNPKAITKSERLYQTYLDLLTFRDSQVQKLAFACVVSYGHKFLMPYRENFERLLDDGSFRSELVLFNVDDGEEGAVHSDHRPEVVPVLLRILYGKMHTRSGSATGGKGSFSARQGAVLRFLANCRQDELVSFLHLEVATLREYLEEDISAMVGKIQATLDLAKVVPIRRLHGTLGTVENVLRHLGALSPGLLPTLLKLTVAVTTYASAILGHKEKVVRPLVAATRALRAQGVKMLTQFFEKFDTYEFTAAEIDAVFESAVWPLLPIVEELGGRQLPTPLLKFFLALSRNPRYFVLFSKFNKDDPGTSALPLIVALLGNSKVSPAIVKTLLTIVDNLLTSTEEEEEADNAEEGAKPVKALTVNCCFDVLARHSTTPASGTLSYGTLLILPYVPHILKRLRLVIEAALRTHKPMSAVEMSILSRISEHLTDPTQCSELARLFLAGFKKLHSPAPEAEQQKLTTVLNLTRTAENPERLLGFAAPLFASLGNRHSRRLLCEIYSAIAERVPRYAELATFVNKVNSWNRRFAEEPDYQTRLEGFRMAAALLNKYKEAPDVPLVLSVIYNCTFTIRAVNDLAVRDAASLALSDAMPVFAAWLSEDAAAYKACVSEALVREIKRGLRSKDEPSRHEFVRVLSQLLRHCGQHPSLSGLAKLCCREDAELDFWDNLCHIQMHRRCRALTRLAASLRAGQLNDLGAASLTDVLLPLTTCFVLNPSYAKQNALVDAAIDLIGAVSGRLPWRPYEALLSRYLQQLQRDTEHHKMAVRLVVAILEAFHFDLSKSQGVQGAPSKPVKAGLPGKPCQADSGTGVAVGEPAEAGDAEAGNAEAGDAEASDAEAADAEVEDGIKDSEDPGKAKQAVAEEEEEKEQAQATAIHTAIANRLLPRLHRVLAQKARSDDEHRAAKSAYPEDTEILRIPIAVAMVKLLQALPGNTLQRHLPSVLLRICEFLKSRSGDIREAARGTLTKVMALLGAPYMGYLLREMKGLLKRGYQVHVLTYTTHAVLDSLSATLKPGDLDSCAQDIVEVCQTELFTDVAEEKEVAQIGAKVKEAKATKSFRIYQLLGALASQDSLPGLTGPLCEVLLSATSHKTVRKCEDCLQHLVLGLSSNEGLPVCPLLVHVHRLVADNCAQLSTSPGEKPAPPKLLAEREDVFLIPREPSRDGLPVRTSKKTNAHVLVEFGLKLLQAALKRERVSASDKGHLEMLDPFVPLLTQLVDSSYVKVVTTSLRCFVRLLRMPLPSLSSHVQRLGRSLFVLLHRHTGASMKQGENMELLMLAFKVVTVLVKEASLFPMEKPQLLVLLSYVERDIHDNSRQSVAFALLKAVLLRRVEAEEVHELMQKVATMSIADERAHVRAQCREAYLQYVLDYPMKRRMKNVVGFFTAQLEYPLESGRLSALEMLHAYSAKFPQKTLQHYSGTLFVSVAARLVNDSSSSVRRVAAAAVRGLLEKLDDNGRTSLFSVALAWCGEKMLATRRLAGRKWSACLQKWRRTSLPGTCRPCCPSWWSRCIRTAFRRVQWQTWSEPRTTWPTCTWCPYPRWPWPAPWPETPAPSNTWARSATTHWSSCSTRTRG
uniref:Putative drim down-regulated in metastasis-like protein n=1 Tax=Ixodes scapularis TaxID=6945 RepID=A0A4D5RSY9_IXOSC